MYIDWYVYLFILFQTDYEMIQTIQLHRHSEFKFTFNADTVYMHVQTYHKCDLSIRNAIYRNHVAGRAIHDSIVDANSPIHHCKLH